MLFRSLADLSAQAEEENRLGSPPSLEDFRVLVVKRDQGLRVVHPLARHDLADALPDALLLLD